MNTCYKTYIKFEQAMLALRCAIQLNNMDLIQEVYNNCKDQLVRKQLSFMLARQQIFWDLDADKMEEADELREIMNNSRLSPNFLNLARELDIMEPKVPEDIYKSHLETNRPSYQAQVKKSFRVYPQNSFNSGVQIFTVYFVKT